MHELRRTPGRPEYAWRRRPLGIWAGSQRGGAPQADEGRSSPAAMRGCPAAVIALKLVVRMEVSAGRSRPPALHTTVSTRHGRSGTPHDAQRASEQNKSRRVHGVGTSEAAGPGAPPRSAGPDVLDGQLQRGQMLGPRDSTRLTPWRLVEPFAPVRWRTALRAPLRSRPRIRDPASRCLFTNASLRDRHGSCRVPSVGTSPLCRTECGPSHPTITYVYADMTAGVAPSRRTPNRTHAV